MEGGNPEWGAIHFHRLCRDEHRFESFIFYQHEVDGPRSLCWRGELNKVLSFSLKGVAHSRKSLNPASAIALSYQQIQVRRISGVAMKNDRETPDNQKIEFPVPRLLFDVLEKAHRTISGSQRPIVNTRVRRRNKSLEQWMRLVRFAVEFGMELARDEKRVLRQFDDFNKLAIRGMAAKAEPALFEPLAI